jgi:hypothetical protein
MQPSSFCTVSTNKCKHELKGLLSSLAYCHYGSNVYIVCDTVTETELKSIYSKKLNCKWFSILDEYSELTRQEMEQKGIWAEFQMSKATAIEKALETETDTLFVDSDIIFIEPVSDIDKTKQLGVSRGYINKETSDKVGIYNGGFLWTNQKTLPERWRHYTKTSRYFDQASIEDLTKEFTTFEFSEQNNVQSWRFIVGEEKNISKFFVSDFKNRRIYYKTKPLRSIHTHFNDRRFEPINQFFIQLITNAKMVPVLKAIQEINT